MDTNTVPPSTAWIAAIIVGVVMFGVCMIVLILVAMTLNAKIRKLDRQLNYMPKDNKSLRSVDFTNNNTMQFPAMSRAYSSASCKNTSCYVFLVEVSIQSAASH